MRELCLDMSDAQGETSDDREPRFAALRALIRRETAVISPPLTPELKIWGAADYLEIWSATESTLAEKQLAPPFWAFAWAGGQALARLLLDDAPLSAGKRVIALAAGAGLEALAAAKSGAAAVTANDVDLAALAAASLNAELNNVRLTLDGADKLGPSSPSLAARFDLILVGDLFYELDLARRAWAALAKAHQDGAEILIGDPDRGRLPTAMLEPIATYDIPTPRDLEGVASRRTSVWRPGPSFGPDFASL